MSSVNMRRIEQQGDLASTSVAELLRSLESSGQTARVWFETEIGVGQVAFHEGRVVVADVGLLRRKSALLRLLSMTEGQYSIEHSAVPAAQPIVPNIEFALSLMVERQQEWRELCEATPPMSSVLKLTAAGKESKLQAKGPERLVYLLIDGRRSLMDVLSEAAVDPIAALKMVVRGASLGHFVEAAESPSLLPLPVEEHSGEVLKIPPPPSVPNFGKADVAPIQAVTARSGRPSSSNDYSLRHGTLVGLGIDISSSSPPPPRPRADSIAGSPIISLSNDGSSPENGDPLSDAARFHPVQPELRRAVPVHRAEVVRSDVDGPISEPADSLIGAAVPTKPEDEVPKVATAGSRFVGRYEVIHRIGRGGMGSVYLARLTTQGGFRRLFALKLLRSYLAHDNDAAEAFLAEARLAGQLHHPNVVSVVDAGVHQSQPYLVMDYVEGCSLKQLMSAHPEERPIGLIVPILLNALEGLHSVHSLRDDDGSPLEVVHCDVSPENLLIGTDGVCRLTDLGVARRARLSGNQSTHGKPGYLAPEQVIGGALDRRVDLFAMGVVMWTALTGERLFHGATVEETLQRVCSQPIPAPSTVGLHPDPALDAVCMKALERDPSKRFATAEEMHIALREVALRGGMLGHASEAAAWVRATVGRELSHRRLLVLEASRPEGGSLMPPETPPIEMAPLSQAPSSSPPARKREYDESRTIRLAEGGTGNGTRYALIVSALLAATMVIVSILWPAALARLFKVNIGSHPPAASSIQVNWAVAPGIDDYAAPHPTGPVPIVTPVTSANPAQPPTVSDTKTGKSTR